MKSLSLIAALAFLASCHAIKKTTTTVTKQTDSSATVTTYSSQDTNSINNLLTGKDVDITIKYFSGNQLREFHDSMLKDTKQAIEQSGGSTSQHLHISSGGFSFIPDHSRISEIDIHASAVTDSLVVTRSSTQKDSSAKREVIRTDQHQVVVEKERAWWQLPVEIGCGLIVLILLLLWLGRKFRII